MSPHYDVLVPGNYYCDLVFTGLPRFPSLGTEVYTQGLEVVPGGVLNTVVALQRLGVRVGWAGHVGDDVFSRFVLELAHAEGIDTSLLVRHPGPLQRVTVALSYPEDRAFVTYVDPAPAAAALVPDLLERITFDHLHFPGLTAGPTVPPLLAACRARGATISMDCQDVPATLDTPFVRDTLAALDVFLPNAAEAQRLTETATLADAAAVLRDLVPLVVIKDGSAGSHAWQGDRRVHADALTLDPVDTTGAGDVFNAGFLTAWRADHDLETCLRWGNVGGGLSTLGYGGGINAPTMEQLQVRLGPDR